MKNFLFHTLAVLECFVCLGPAWGAPVATPHLAREQKLKLKGALKPNAPTSLSVVELDSAFKAEKLKIKSHFTDESEREFEGIPVAALVARFAQDGIKSIKVVATNEYAQTLQPEDWKMPRNFLLAYRENGATIERSRRGTFRLVNEASKFSPEDQGALWPKWVWQVSSVEFVK